MSARYGVREIFNGRFRIVKLFGNEDFAEKGSYATRELAEGRVAQLERRAARTEAVTAAKRRAKNRCECKGKCGQHFDERRPCPWGEGDDVPGVGKVVLVAVPLDGDDNNLSLTNIRMLCQLCKQHHDADRINGGAALFDIKEPE